jgi:hypothetical protein
MEILLISYVKLVMINVHYVLGLLSMNVKHVSMDIILMEQHVNHVIQLVLNAQDFLDLIVKNVKLLIGLNQSTRVNYVMFLVMVVLVLEMEIVKFVVLQD